MKLRIILTSLIVLGLSIAMTGCEGGVKKEEELAAAQAALEQTQQDLAAVTQARDLLKEQVAELIRSRNAAVEEVKASKARVDKLTKQYQEQATIIRELQEHMKQMQAAIEKL